MKIDLAQLLATVGDSWSYVGGGMQGKEYKMLAREANDRASHRIFHSR